MSDFKAKMHQIRFPLGLGPDPAGRAYSAPPEPLAVFKGPTSKGTEGKGKGRAGEGKRGEGSPNWGVWIRKWFRLYILLLMSEPAYNGRGKRKGRGGLPPPPQLGSLDPPV